MSRFFYFKMTFLSISAGLFAGLLIYGLFDIDFSNKEAWIQLLLKSLVAALLTGLVLGFLNMYFKIGNFQKQRHSQNEK